MKEMFVRDFVYDMKWMLCYDIDFLIFRFISYYCGFRIVFLFYLF